MGAGLISLLLLLLWLGLVRVAWSAPWAAGLPVAQVSLEAPLGGLPRENLEPLLRVQQGEPLDLQQLRADIGLLYRAGSFAAVEAIAEPWLYVGPDGEPGEGVRITYRVLPPPRLVDIAVEGARGPARRVALDAANLHLGEAFYAEEALDALEKRIAAALAAEGWPGAVVSVRAEEVGPREIKVDLVVDPGEKHVYGRVTLTGTVFAGDEGGLDWPWAEAEAPPLGEGRARRRLRRHGIASGRRVTLSGLDAAQDDLADLMATNGWLQGRPTFLFTPGEADPRRERLSVICDGGPRTTVRARGRGLPSDADLLDTVGLRAGDRVRSGSADEARRRLGEWYDHRGYLSAQVDVALQEKPWGTELLIDADRGPRHVLKRIEVQGAETFTPAYLAAAMREAAPETLGDRVVSRADLEVALQAVREFYRGQGFLAARTELVELRTGGRRLPLPFRLWGVDAVPVVRIEEGPRTMLAELAVEGGTGLEADLVDAARAELQGQPVSPSKLDALARAVADAYRAQGHLSADVRAELEVDREANLARAALVVRPGVPIRLRSVVIRGNRRTRRSVIEREVALTVGEPLSVEGLAATRSNLYDLDLFSVVEPELIGDDDRSRDLLLQLEEKPNITLEAGGGIATDQGVQARGRAAHRNLGGLGQRVEAVGQMGYGWYGDEWRFDLAEPVWSTALLYEAPNLPARGQRLVVEALIHETVQQPTFRLDRSGGRVGLRVGRRGIDEVFVDYSVQVRRIDDIDRGALVMGDPWLGLVGLDENLEGTLDTPSDRRIQAGPSILLLRDRRDDRFNPTRGSLVSFVAQLADGLWAEPVMARGSVRVERLAGLGPAVLGVVARGGLGWAQGSATTLPVEERFYLGGSASLRGFRLDSVGPENESGRPAIPYPEELAELVEDTAIRGAPSHWIATGGDAMAALSLELRVPMTRLGFAGLDSTSLVAFGDTGWVGFLDPAVHADSALLEDRAVRVGLGLGLRIATPIGPAAIDIGVNPWPLSYRDEPRVVPHLSLGAL